SANSAVQPHHLGNEAKEEHQRHRGQDQAQADVVLLAVGCHGAVCWGVKDGHEAQPITLVAVASSLGGFSKVWKGAGEGTSHSRPSAPSQGFCGALAPLPRMAGTIT